MPRCFKRGIVRQSYKEGTLEYKGNLVVQTWLKGLIVKGDTDTELYLRWHYQVLQQEVTSTRENKEIFGVHTYSERMNTTLWPYITVANTIKSIDLRTLAYLYKGVNVNKVAAGLLYMLSMHDITTIKEIAITTTGSFRYKATNSNDIVAHRMVKPVYNLGNICMNIKMLQDRKYDVSTAWTYKF